MTFDRSPSPEPIYNTEGKRLNTREYRVRKRLEEERHTLVQVASLRNPDYKPPIDYRYLLICILQIYFNLLYSKQMIHKTFLLDFVALLGR